MLQSIKSQRDPLLEPGVGTGLTRSPWWKWAMPRERARGGAIPGGAGQGSGRDEAGAAGGPGLLGIHVSHHRGHDVAGGALRPIQTSALLRVVMEHAEDMACGAEALLVATNPIPGPSVGCRPIKAWLQLWRIRSIPNLLLPPVSFWCSKGFSVCSPHFSVSLPPDIFRGPP